MTRTFGAKVRLMHLPLQREDVSSLDQRLARVGVHEFDASDAAVEEGR
jgi:hypothetical protein